mgnify:CR=1 FL=1
MSELNVNNITKSTGTEVVVNDASEDVDFRVESNGNANMLTVNGGSNIVGVAADPDLGVGLHIKSADSGASVDSYADELVVEGSGNSGLTIASGNSSEGSIYFADDGDTNKGRVVYYHASDSVSHWVNDLESLKIDSAGAVTKPLQPAFLAYASSTTNVTGDGTIITIVYGNEVFDQGGDYDTTTGIFTAPITGRYIVSTTFEFEPDSNHDTTYGYFISSNRSYPIFWQNPSATESAAGLLDIMGSTVLDMDSGDTVFVRWLVSGGSKTSDYGTANTFGGYLIC